MAFAACLAAGLAAPSRAAATDTECATGRTDISSWPIVRSPRVPGLTLRLPRSFEREPDPGQQGASSSVPSARWTDPSRGRLLISWGAMAAAASPEAGPGYTRCEEKVGSAVAVIVSYARREASAPSAGGSPYRVQARLRWADGEEAVVSGDAADPERFGELLAAVRTIRRVGA